MHIEALPLLVTFLGLTRHEWLYIVIAVVVIAVILGLIYRGRGRTAL